MSNLHLEHLLCLSLIIPFLLKLDALPAPRSNSPISGKRGFRSIGGSERFESNDESITSGKKDGYEFEFHKLPDARIPHHTNNKELMEHLLEQTRVLHAIDARLAAHVQAGLEELLHEEHRLQEHVARGPSAEMGRRIKRWTRNNKPRRRAPYDFIVL